MIRRFAIVATIVTLVLLAACAAPTATAPTVTPVPPSVPVVTLPPVGVTVLPSDLGNPPGRIATSTPTPASVTTPDSASQPQTPPAADTSPTQLASSGIVSYDAALRQQSRGDLNLVNYKTLYQMKWELNADVSQLHGTSKVTFANQTSKPLNEIYFRLFANAAGDQNIIVNSVQIGGKAAKSDLQTQDTVLHIPLATPLRINGVIQIDLDYTVTPPTADAKRYNEFVHLDWITTLPTVYPLIPADDDQGWHLELPPPYGDLVYAPSSIYDVSITTPSLYKVIASGQMVQETQQGGQTTRRFIGAPMRDFDANISNTLIESSKMVNDVAVNSWYLPIHTSGGKQALQWTGDAMSVYENRFGPYPFKELDLVESPTSAGGIEYPGLITVASNFYNDAGQLKFFEFATVHETAHQWFYSTVGNDQVNHPWLDESLVQYASLIYFQDHYGAAIANALEKAVFDQPYQQGKTKYGDMLVGMPVTAYDEDSYGIFVYAKGPKFFHALRDQMSDALFFKGLQTYYQQFKFRIAQPQDLLNVLNQVSGQNLKPLFDEWVGM